ncbi:MAG: response regulator [Halobacteria archaeon]|nr:response regulator [Halobacteria archaeon]
MQELIRVLYVDDDSDFADLTVKSLESFSESITADYSLSASEALERLDGGDVDCVVSDYYMPDFDGIKFLEEVREENPELPFILFTGKGSEDVASEAISAGVDDYLQKSSGVDRHDWEVLANRIENIVGQKRAESTYQEIFDKASAGMVILDKEMNDIIDVNQRICELLGYSNSLWKM